VYKITAKIKEGAIIPSNNFDRHLVNELDSTKPYIIEIKRGRKINSLGKYWLLMSGFAYVKNEGSKEFWHSQFKKMYFGFTEIKNPFTGRIEQEVESISFESMDEVRFQEYLTWCFEKLLSVGIDGNSLISNYINRG
jgi:hypothetical protein